VGDHVNQKENEQDAMIPEQPEENTGHQAAEQEDEVKIETEEKVSELN
jgi:hypothetical protein